MRSRTSGRWTVAAALFVLLGQTWGMSSAARAAVGQETLLPSTPLVLKDGRIANVSIHLLPFGSGDGALAGDAAAALTRLTAQIATDCFLTAQVIGHVSSREVAENETLEAHRLARSRADAVQSSLIGGGLPAKSIASVWDWQFLVREPRATLWVFRLIEGEDCEGAPLDGAAPQLVAENAAAQQARALPADAPANAVADEPTNQRAAGADEQPAEAPAQVARSEPPVAEQAEPQTTSTLPPMVSSAVAAEAAPERVADDTSTALDALVDAVVDAEAQLDDASEQSQQASEPPAPDDLQVTDVSRGSNASGPREGAVEARAEEPRVVKQAGAAVGSVPTITRPIPALSPAQPDAVASGRSAETTVAAVDPAPASEPGARAATTAGTQQAARPEDPERQGKVEWGKDGNVVITFATNSSYFPPGTARRLSSMIDRLASGQPYRVQLQVGVSGTDTVVGATSPEEARRYNQWLAERRMARVRDWLAENAKDRQLEIEPVFEKDESSRRLLVRVAPVG